MEESLRKLLFDPTIGKIITIVVGLSIVWVLVKFLQRRFLWKIVDNNQRYKAKKFTGFIGFVLCVVLITIVYSDKLGGLTVALGVAGAGIAFALQEVIASFAGWLVIMFGGFYKSGDRVQVGGIVGDVMDIGVLRTTLMETGKWVDGDLYNGRIVYVANSFVFKEPVYNYSGDFEFLWDELKVPIHFGSDYELVEELLYDICEEHLEHSTDKSKNQWAELQNKYRLEDARTSPMVSMEVTDGGVIFTLRYVVNYRKRRLTKSMLYKRILQTIENSEGNASIATTTINIDKIGAIKIKPEEEI